MQVGTLDIKGIDQIKRVYSPEGLCPTITTMAGGNRQPKVEVSGAAMRGRYDEAGVVHQRLELNNQELSNAITTVQKDSLVSIKSNVKKGGGFMNNGEKNFRIRKLTPLEL